MRRIAKRKLRGRRICRPDRARRDGISCVRRRDWHDWPVQNIGRRLGGRIGLLGNFRNAIAAARARQVLAVRQKRFAGVKSNLFPSPVNAIADAIRDVDLAFGSKPDEVCGLNMEIGVVGGGHTVFAEGILKFPCAGDSSRYD